MKHIPELDGLRGISIIAVLFTHYGLGVTFSGQLGVTIFFFISGFLITRLLIAEYIKTQTVNLRLFYIRRILRLYPALVLMIITVIAATAVMGCTLPAGSIFASLFYFINYYIVLYKSAFVNGCLAMFNPLWSLAVEEHFYLLYPLLFLLKYNEKRRFMVLLSLLALGVLVYRLLKVFISQGNLYEADADSYMLTHTRFDSILYGCITALILEGKRRSEFLSIAVKPIYFFSALIFLYLSFKIHNFYFHSAIQYTVQGICISFIIPPLIYGSNYRKYTGFLRSKLLTTIGKMSYSIYLFHYISVIVANRYIGHKNTHLSWFATAIIPGLLLSIFSYYVVERRFIPMRKRFGSGISDSG